MIKLSIITINLNNSSGLARTLRSVEEQTYTNFEYLLIDGCSTDGSLDLIQRYESLITYWVSEPDNGIYHAMNKGIQQAIGEYCLFLNSGDWLAEPTILEKVFSKQPEADIVAGDVYFYDTAQDAIKWNIESPDQLTAKTLFLGTLPHQATFIRCSLFNKVGLYNEELKIASDWLFFLEALLEHECTYQHYNGVVSYFNMDGISCDPASESLPRREQLTVLRQKYPLFLADYQHLDSLEKQVQLWQDSKEFRVYGALRRIGLIRVGVICIRIKNLIKRILLQIV